MSGTYKGFWSPTQTYLPGDIVEYYSVGSDLTKSRYKLNEYSLAGGASAPEGTASLISSVTYNSLPNYEPDNPGLVDKSDYESSSSVGPVPSDPSAGAPSCPLKNFSYPVLSQEGALKSPSSYSPTDGDLLIFLSQQDLYARSEAGWSDYAYFKDPLWVGPNGANRTLNSPHWEIYTGENSNWVNPTTYDVSGQKFESTSLSTLSEGKYGDPVPDKSVDFDEVQGETDSDAYYLSTIQNYSGNFNRTNSYQKFDIVRDQYSHLFYYARRAVTPHHSDTGDGDAFETLTLTDVVIRPPTDYAYSESHIGTIEYMGADDDHDFTSDYRVGDLLDFSKATGLSKSANQRKFNIIGVGSALIWLGDFESATEVALVEVEGYSADGSLEKKNIVSIERYSADIKAYGSCTIEGNNDKASCEKATDANGNKGVWTEHNDSIWSHDKFFFDADYGSKVVFKARNKQTQYGEGYTSVSPLGINSLGIGFDLRFTNRSNREANAIIHFLENQLGQHETDEKSYYLDYDQGISGFFLDGDTLFFPYNNPENLSRRFYCFDYEHTIEDEDVNSVNAKIMNSNSSTLNVAEQIFVNKAPVWQAEKTYNLHDVVFCPDNYQYYYSRSPDPHSTFRPWVKNSQGGGVTSINKDKWTREFYWSPSLDFGVSHSAAIDEVGSDASPYTQYYPSTKQNITLLNISLSFKNRSNEEAYAILHFLESHLGYKSFLFVPPAPYNRKRRFYCESWEHTYVFRNNHTITASFVQYPLGQNTPLDDDEIDSIGSSVSKLSGEMSLQENVSFQVYLSPADIVAGTNFTAKQALLISNTGETDIELDALDPPNNTAFTTSDWGEYKGTVLVTFEESEQTYALQSPTLRNLGDNNSLIFRELNAEGELVNDHSYVQTALGQIYKIGDPWQLIADTDQTKTQAEYVALPDDDSGGAADHKKLYSETKALPILDVTVPDVVEPSSSSILKPGEEAVIEVRFNTTGQVTTSVPYKEVESSFSIPYYYGPTNEPQWAAGDSYSEGNVVQHNDKVYRLTVSTSTSATFVTGDWERVAKTKTVNLNAVINPSLLDDKKKKISIDIKSSSSGVALRSSYNIHDNVDNIFQVHQGEDNHSSYKDIQWNVSEEGSSLAAPEDIEEFEEIAKLHTDLEGYLYLGIEFDGNGAYKNVYTGAPITIPFGSSAALTDQEPGGTRLAVKPNKVDDEFQFAVLLDNSEKAVGHVRQTFGLHEGTETHINLAEKLSLELAEFDLEEIKDIEVVLSGVFLGSNASIPVIDVGMGYHEEATINIKLGKRFPWVLKGAHRLTDAAKTAINSQVKTTESVDGWWQLITDSTEVISDAQYYALPNDASSGATDHRGLYSEAQEIISVNMDDMLEFIDEQTFSELTVDDRLHYGSLGGLAQEVSHESYLVLNQADQECYESEETLPCYIVGKGGRGGNGMQTEGVIKEAGEPVEASEEMLLPEDGEKGGDAIHIPEYPQNVTIEIVDGGIYAGGGGGGGGGYHNNVRRIKTSSFVNIAGGGGGGAGNGIGGAPMGGRGALVPDSDQGAIASNPGETINNNPAEYTTLVDGGKGGTFGEPGETIAVVEGKSYRILGEPGEAGRAITWSSSGHVPTVRADGAEVPFLSPSEEQPNGFNTNYILGKSKQIAPEGL